VPRLGEGGRITFRADFFNLLTHANLGNPDSVLGSSTFGIASYGRQGREADFPTLTPLREMPRQVEMMLRLEF